MSDKQNIESPHETRPFQDHGHMDVVTLGDFTLGRGMFEPGWRWSNDVKPIAGTDSCQVHHTGFCVSGQMTVRFDSGEEMPSAPATWWSSTPATTPGRGRRGVRAAGHRRGGVREAQLRARRAGPMQHAVDASTTPLQRLDRGVDGVLHARGQPRRRRSSSLIAGTTSCRSPITA